MHVAIGINKLCFELTNLVLKKNSKYVVVVAWLTTAVPSVKRMAGKVIKKSAKKIF